VPRWAGRWVRFNGFRFAPCPLRGYDVAALSIGVIDDVHLAHDRRGVRRRAPTRISGPRGAPLLQ
jgi:hypothetical protein